MKRMLILGIVFVVALASAARAGDERRGTAGAQFLRIAPDARSIGMGNAAIAVADNASGLYWNPAGITGVERNDVAFTHLNYLLDINYNYVGIVHAFSENTRLGFSLGVLSVGDIEVTTVDAPDGTGATFSPYDMVVGVTYAQQVIDRVSVGVTAKYIRQTIDQLSAQGIAGDIGFQYITGLQGLKFGITMTNFGPRMQFKGEQLNTPSTFPGSTSDSQDEVYSLVSDSFELPSELKIGIAYNLLAGRSERNHVIFSMDGIHPNFAGDRLNFGMEGKFNNLLYGRLGYSVADQKNFTEGLSAGVGVNLGMKNIGVRIDYSYSDMSELGKSQRFTMGLAF